MFRHACAAFLALAVCAGACGQTTDITTVKAQIAERLAALESYSADTTTRMNLGAMTMVLKGTERGKGAMSESITAMDMVGMKMNDRILVDATGARWEIRNVLGDLFVSKSAKGKGGMDGSSVDFGLWMGYGSENLNPRKVIETFEAGYDLFALGVETLDGVECYVIMGTFHEEKLEELRTKAKERPAEEQGVAAMVENLLSGFVELRAYIGTADGFPRKVELQSKEGKPTTTLTYTNVAINPAIDDSVFAYTPPDGIEIEDLDLVKSTSAVRLRQRAPAFAETAFDGSELALADYEGKVVLLDFWATWCAPCMVELPNVIALYDEYHAKGLEIIGVSLDGDRSNIETLQKENPGMKWPQFFDGNAWESKLAVLYGIEALPFTVLISRDGTILSLDLHGEALEKAVAEALGDE